MRGKIGVSQLNGSSTRRLWIRAHGKSMTFVTENTRAWLLLAAPLIVGDAEEVSTKVLSLGEANKLARRLKEVGAEPLELLGNARTQLLEKLSPLLSSERLENLLDRGFQMSQALEKWSARGIWVTSRADTDYPERLKSKLNEQAPTLIYGCGDQGLLQNGGLAVVGSRNADEQSLNFTQTSANWQPPPERPLFPGARKAWTGRQWKRP